LEATAVRKDAGERASGTRPLTVGMRRMLIVASGLVLGTGLILTLFTRRTADLFAWPIDPPMTAAFLGAGYLASVDARVHRAHHGRHLPALRPLQPRQR
jgi:hypothetical protein